ncbi:hypothetical protein [Streptomyces sp. NPDC051776]|uniref:hypothetical protein n=1 Tax=Streptomyces sp. NPDC051776 TaxID=3155414 RepID=UPI003419D73C
MSVDPATDLHDIELRTLVSADRLRFRAPPRTDVRFTGATGRDAMSRARRSNLPEPVQTGEAYRDVRVAYVLANRLCTAENNTAENNTAQNNTAEARAAEARTAEAAEEGGGAVG